MDREKSKRSLLFSLLLLRVLNKFETEENWKNSKLDYYDVAGIEEDKTISYIDPKEVPGGIVLWNSTTQRKLIVNSETYSTERYPEEKYTPIGVIVIPASHMDDGRARMMSLRWMSCDDPENGSITYNTMIWGTDTDLTGLTNFTQVPAIARYDDEGAGGIIALTEPQEIYTAVSASFLPSDDPSWTGETNPEDPGTRWHNSGTYWCQNESGETIVDAYNFYAPSPYASDGTPNPLYRATEYSGGSINNALSYFDGRHQSDVLLEARGTKDYSSWKPTSGVPEDFPAVSCCDMYHTVGTSQGDWYLPSQAELGYVVARLSDINNAVRKVGSMQNVRLVWLWSSTEQSSSSARCLTTYHGNLYGSNRKATELRNVIAFTMI